MIQRNRAATPMNESTSFINSVGVRSWGTWLRHCATSRKVAGSIPFRPYYSPGVDSTFNRNEYQGCLLGVKVAGA